MPKPQYRRRSPRGQRDRRLQGRLGEPGPVRKVLNVVGSFVNLRGGDVYPERVLQARRKPLHVFLCDGRNDNRGVRNGIYDPRVDWFLQNVRLKDVLAKVVLPDMMQWLWHDAPVSTDSNDAAERTFRPPAPKG